jgi:hypothetical protein
MALSPEQCLGRLRVLYRDASDALVVAWARTADTWATYAIRHYDWSFLVAEAVVRQCRSYVKRASLAVEGA